MKLEFPIDGEFKTFANVEEASAAIGVNVSLIAHFGSPDTGTTVLLVDGMYYVNSPRGGADSFKKEESAIRYATALWMRLDFGCRERDTAEAKALSASEYAKWDIYRQTFDEVRERFCYSPIYQ